MTIAECGTLPSSFVNAPSTRQPRGIVIVCLPSNDPLKLIPPLAPSCPAAIVRYTTLAAESYARYWFTRAVSERTGASANSAADSNTIIDRLRSEKRDGGRKAASPKERGKQHGQRHLDRFAQHV